MARLTMWVQTSPHYSSHGYLSLTRASRAPGVPKRIHPVRTISSRLVHAEPARWRASAVQKSGRSGSKHSPLGLEASSNRPSRGHESPRSSFAVEETAAAVVTSLQGRAWRRVEESRSS